MAVMKLHSLWAGCVALLAHGCVTLPEDAVLLSSNSLIPAATLTALGAHGTDQAAWRARLGQPFYEGHGGQFFAYQRRVEFRNVWQRQSGSRTASVPIGPVRNTIIFYQIVGAWFDAGGHVTSTRQFMAPCGSCNAGDELMSGPEIERSMTR